MGPPYIQGEEGSVAVRHWGRVEDRLRERADGLRRVAPHAWAPVGGSYEAAPGVSPAGVTCADCRARISPERLRAAPAALRCLACQRAVEASGTRV